MSLECKKARGAGVDAGRGVMRTESEKKWNVSQELPQKWNQQIKTNKMALKQRRLRSHLKMVGECYKNTNVIHSGVYFIKISYARKGWRKVCCQPFMWKTPQGLHRSTSSVRASIEWWLWDSHTYSTDKHMYTCVCACIYLHWTQLSGVKNPPADTGEAFNPRLGRIPWRSKWQPAPVFLPGRSHGQRSLATGFLTTEGGVKCG